MPTKLMHKSGVSPIWPSALQDDPGSVSKKYCTDAGSSMLNRKMGFLSTVSFQLAT